MTVSAVLQFSAFHENQTLFNMKTATDLIQGLCASGYPRILASRPFAELIFNQITDLKYVVHESSADKTYCRALLNNVFYSSLQINAQWSFGTLLPSPPLPQFLCQEL